MTSECSHFAALKAKKFERIFLKKKKKRGLADSHSADWPFVSALERSAFWFSSKESRGKWPCGIPACGKNEHLYLLILFSISTLHCYIIKISLFEHVIQTSSLIFSGTGGPKTHISGYSMSVCKLSAHVYIMLNIKCSHIHKHTYIIPLSVHAHYGGH